MDVTQTITGVGSALGAAAKLVEFLKAVGLPHGADKKAIGAAEEQLFAVKEALYTAKGAILAQQDRIAELINRIKELEVRLAEREEHALEALGAGAFVYVRKSDAEAIKRGPWFCQPCFEDGKKNRIPICRARLAFRCI